MLQTTDTAPHCTMLHHAITSLHCRYMKYFLNASNHDDNEPPQIASYHWGSTQSGAEGAKFFTDWDAFLKSHVDPIGDFKRQLGSQTELVLNEFIPFINDWCDCTGK